MHLSVFDVTFIHMHLLKFIGFSHNSRLFLLLFIKIFHTRAFKNKNKIQI